MATSAFTISGRGALDIIDSQFHLSHTLGIDALVPAMDALGISGLIADELWGRDARDHPIPSVDVPGGFRPVSPLAQAAAIRCPERFCYLQRLSRHDPQLTEIVKVLASTPGCRAVRASMRNETEWAAFRAGAYDRILELAQDHGLPLFVLGRNAGELLADTPRRYPALKLIVDHCGWLDPQGDIPVQWAKVLEMAQHPNVYLKWCHASHFFGRPGDAAGTLQQAFMQAMNAFSAERIMWASDTTHEQSRQTWRDLLNFVDANTGLTSHERQWVLGKTVRSVLDWALPS